MLPGPCPGEQFNASMWRLPGSSFPRRWPPPAGPAAASDAGSSVAAPSAVPPGDTGRHRLAPPPRQPPAAPEATRPAARSFDIGRHRPAPKVTDGDGIAILISSDQLL